MHCPVLTNGCGPSLLPSPPPSLQDAIYGNLGVTEDRAALFDYTQPYMSGGESQADKERRRRDRHRGRVLVVSVGRGGVRPPHCTLLVCLSIHLPYPTYLRTHLCCYLSADTHIL